MSQIDSSGVESADTDAMATVESSYLAGLQAIGNGNLEEARQWAGRCTAAPGGAEAAQCAILHGLIAAEAGDFEDGVAHFRRAVAIKPDDVTIVRQLGQLLATSGAPNEAIELLKATLERFPDHSDLLVDLGYVSIISGNHQDARAALEQAEALQPLNIEIQYALAQMYETLGEPARAASALAAVARDAAAPVMLTDLARLYLQLESYKEAEAVFRRLEAVDPEHVLFAQHGQIWCRIKRQDWRGALDLALETTRLDRFDLTTALLAYAKDRLFAHIPDAEQREADLSTRLMEQLREHSRVHSNDVIPGWGPARKGE